MKFQLSCAEFLCPVFQDVFIFFHVSEKKKKIETSRKKCSAFFLSIFLPSFVVNNPFYQNIVKISLISVYIP